MSIVQCNLIAFVWGSWAAGTSKTDNGDTSSVPKWYVTALIDIYMTSPSVSLWKTVQHRQDYLSRWQIKIQNAIQYKDRSPNWWCLAHTMTSARAWGCSNRASRSACLPHRDVIEICVKTFMNKRWFLRQGNQQNSVIMTISEIFMNVYRLFKTQTIRHKHQKKPSKLLLS